MEMPSVSVDDEVFVGPMTLHEMKLRLTKKYYTPSSDTRHTIIGLPGSSETNEREAVEVSIDNSPTSAIATDVSATCTEDDSVTSEISKCVLLVSDEDDEETEDRSIVSVEDDGGEISVITISSGDENEEMERVFDESIEDTPCQVKREVLSLLRSRGGANGSQNESQEIVSKPSEFYCDSMRTTASNYSYVENGEEQEKADLYAFSGGEEEEEEGESNSISCEKPSYDSLDLDEQKDLFELSKSVSHGLRKTNEYYDSLVTSRDEHSEELQQQADELSYKPQPQQPKPKSTKKKYDYLISKVGQYIKTPMAPPPAPRSAKKQLPPTPKTTTAPLKNLNFNHIVSPLGLYIKSGSRTPLVQNVKPTPMKSSNTGATGTVNKACRFDTLPKVVYKPAQMRVVTGEERIKLPGSVKKLFPQNIQSISHKGRMMERNIDVSKELEKTDLSSIGNSTMADGDVSVLSIRNAFVK